MLHITFAYTEAGRPETAIEQIHRALQIHPDSSQLLAVEAYVQAKAGHRDRALEIVHDIERRKAPPAHTLGLVWAALGDRDRAFEWLERAYRERVFLLRSVVILPGCAPLRSDPRYADLLRRMGLDAGKWSR